LPLLKIELCYNPDQPFLDDKREKINLAAIDGIRKAYNEELQRVMLTKIKK
jgi:hypothetical protein